MVSTELIPGFTKLKADFEDATTELVELHCIRHEMFLKTVKLQNELQKRETEAFERRSELRNKNTELSNLRAKVCD